jgi:hypothetical protein
VQDDGRAPAPRLQYPWHGLRPHRRQIKLLHFCSTWPKPLPRSALQFNVCANRGLEIKKTASQYTITWGWFGFDPARGKSFPMTMSIVCRGFRLDVESPCWIHQMRVRRLHMSKWSSSVRYCKPRDADHEYVLTKYRKMILHTSAAMEGSSYWMWECSWLSSLYFESLRLQTLLGGNIASDALSLSRYRHNDDYNYTTYRKIDIIHTLDLLATIDSFLTQCFHTSKLPLFRYSSDVVHAGFFFMPRIFCIVSGLYS